MSERDQVAVLLKTLERPVEPRREFTDALRERLLAELGDGNGHRAWVPRPPRLPPRPRRSRRVLVVALAVVLAAGALAAVLLSRPGPASALDLIRQAQRQAASLSPFDATVRFDINPDGKGPGAPKGATQTWQVSYGGPKRLRTVLSGAHLAVPGARPVGSYDVLNGNRYGSYDPQRKIFHTYPVSRYLRPLGVLAWQGGYPDWEKFCSGQAGQVLPDARLVGRDARHIRCTAPGGQVWQLWIDRQTGLLLKLIGQTGGGGDSFLDSAPLTSQRGGFTISRLRYHPAFPPGTFKIAAPPGALDFEARLREAEAKLPPLRALVIGHVHGHTRLEERLSWRDSGTWRIEFLVGGGPYGGPGSYQVAAHGKVGDYRARDKSFSTTATPALTRASVNAVIEAGLLREDDPSYPGDCPIVGQARIEGRPAVHRRCPDTEIWTDTATGLILQTKAPGWVVRLRGLRFHPTFRAGTFHLNRPAPSRGAHQRENDPYYKTALKPGKPAPNWRAHLLNGDGFQITDLRGKPALLVLLPASCLNALAEETTCDVFTPLERMHRQSEQKLAIVWVDLEHNRPEANKVIRHNHLTFSVVIDGNGTGLASGSNSFEAWKFQSYPYWVLLDSHGRVIEARMGPQTLSRLRQLVNGAK